MGDLAGLRQAPHRNRFDQRFTQLRILNAFVKKRRIGRTRRDAIAIDAVACDLARESLGERDQRSFAAGVKVSPMLPTRPASLDTVMMRPPALR